MGINSYKIINYFHYYKTLINMKSILFKKLALVNLLLFLIIPFRGYSLDTIGYYNYNRYYNSVNPNIEPYIKSEIKSTFNDRFKDDTENDFKRLREFLREKEDLCMALKIEKNRYYEIKNQLERKKQDIKRLENIIKFPNDGGNYYIQQDLLNSYDAYYDSSYSSLSKEQVEQRMGTLKIEIEQKQKELESKEKILDTNIKNVEQDIYDCLKRIDFALAPEYKQQDFRTNISMYFTILIGVLLVVFFYIVFKKSDNSLSKELLSGNGLQFITLFVLIIVITLFGILNILQGSELAAILSGISGYILGKGIPKTDDNKRTNTDNKPLPDNGGGVNNDNKVPYNSNSSVTDSNSNKL